MSEYADGDGWEDVYISFDRPVDSPKGLIVATSLSQGRDRSRYLSLLCAGQARQTERRGSDDRGTIRSAHARARQVDPELKSETLFQKKRTERARREGKHKTRGTASDAKKR
jgi:hypothetical protein